jgi:fluoride exporter
VPEPAASSAASVSGLAGALPAPGTSGAPPPSGPRRVLARADGRTVAAIFAGGALGTLARAALAEAFPHAATAWPWPTFAVNIVAAFLLGYFVTRLQERLPLSSYRRPLLGTGVCGGLSTFSTMEVEILKMLSAHAYGLAAGYAAASVAAGYAALHLATALVRRARVRR